MVHFSVTIFNINKKKLNRHIRMISEGSCDPEDWSNDAENTALITVYYMLKYIQIENNFVIIFHNITAYFKNKSYRLQTL